MTIDYLNNNGNRVELFIVIVYPKVIWVINNAFQSEVTKILQGLEDFVMIKKNYQWGDITKNGSA